MIKKLIALIMLFSIGRNYNKTQNEQRLSVI